MNNNGGGTSSVIARHDYLPFGEEIGANVGMRTMARGYNVPDSNRQKYAMLERDSTGLDHTWWRKYESAAGRWTSPDPMQGSIGDPQSFNAFTYSANDPVNLVDPSGLLWDFPEAMYGFDHFANGFWGWGDLNNRRHGHDGPLDTRNCPPGHICFKVPIDDRGGYQLIDLGVRDDFQGLDDILRDARAKVREHERNSDAWHDYEDCVRNSQEGKAYEKAFNKAALRASLPIPGALGIGKVTVRTVSGAAAGRGVVASLVTSSNIFTLAFSAALNVLIANPAAETQGLWDKVKPVQQDCLKKAQNKYGFKPVDPYWLGRM